MCWGETNAEYDQRQIREGHEKAARDRADPNNPAYKYGQDFLQALAAGQRTQLSGKYTIPEAPPAGSGITAMKNDDTTAAPSDAWFAKQPSYGIVPAQQAPFQTPQTPSWVNPMFGMTTSKIGKK